MSEVVEVPEEIRNQGSTPDSIVNESEPSTSVDLFEDVLVLPSEVTQHIINTGDVRIGVAAFVKEIADRARSDEAESSRALTIMTNLLSVDKNTNNPDRFAEVTQVDDDLTDDIRRVAYKGTTMHNAMRKVRVDFPSAIQHRINLGKGVESEIKLKNRNGRTEGVVPLGHALEVIMDAEAAR